MVVETSPGIYKCERVFCEKTFSAEGEAASHEGRNSEHLRVIDLSTLPGDLKRSGFVNVVLARGNLVLLSTKRLPNRYDAELEASVWVHTLNEADMEREEKKAGERPI